MSECAMAAQPKAPTAPTANGSTVLQRQCACGAHSIAGGECEGCRAQKQTVQRVSLASFEGQHQERKGVPSIVREVLGTPGQPLDTRSRAFFEPRFGHDFSHVRMHTGAKAAASARAVNALAYTVGPNVVMGAGQLRLDTAADRHVLAHELSHVVQQRGHSATAVDNLRIGAASSAYEREADAAASLVAGEAPATGGVANLLQRTANPIVMRTPIFTSTFDICHNYLRSREFHVSEGGLVVTARGDWAADEWRGSEPPECGPRNYAMELREVGWLGSPRGNCEFEVGRSETRRWTNLPEGDYYLGINAYDHRPICCLRGDIEVSQQRGLTGQTCSVSMDLALERLSRAWGYARQELAPEVARQVEHLFSPASLAAMAAFAALYIASQLTPVGWIADALALIVLGLTVVFVGALAIEIARDLFRFFAAVNATTDEQLRASGQALARALARGGIGILIALLTRGLRGATRPPPPGTATSTAMVEVVAPGGVPVRVPVAVTVAEAVEASRLQGLASYAVMVPPPGGSDPGSPSSGGGGGRREGASEVGEGGRRGRSPEAGRGGGFSLSRVEYGSGPLSQLAQRMRLLLGLRRGGNVAVFEFENLPSEFLSMARRLGGRNVHFEGNRMAVQNVNGSAHSEELAHMLITQARRAGIELNVRRIYTEYNPCTDTCLPLIRREYPSAEVTYSFIWELWGRQTPDRNAAVEALFAGAAETVP